MEFSWPGEKVFLRIADLFDKGVSAGLRPWQTKREAVARAEARRLELLDAAQTMNDAEDIRARRKAYSLEGGLRALPKITSESSSNHAAELTSFNWFEAARNDQLAEELRKLANLKAIAVYAEEETERITDSGMKDAEVEPDWFVHWRRLAEQTSNEEGRRLWARVLAGEAKSPGTYGHRTLEFLAMMTTRDASAIEKVAKFRVDNNAILAEFQDLYDAEGLHIEELLHLENIGVLINTGTVIGLSHYFTPLKDPLADGYYVAVNCNGACLVLGTPEEKKLDMPAAIFSELGIELMSFVEPESSIELLARVAVKAAEKGFINPRIGKAVDGQIVDMQPFVR